MALFKATNGENQKVVMFTDEECEIAANIFAELSNREPDGVNALQLFNIGVLLATTAVDGTNGSRTESIGPLVDTFMRAPTATVETP